MCKLFCVTFVIMLAACNTPKVGFRYTDQSDSKVGLNHFTVFYNATDAQALRHNRIRLRDTDQVVADAVVAIESVTGCVVKPRSIRGDPALVIVRLKCG